MNKLGNHLNVKRLIQLARISLSDDWRPFLLAGLVFSGLAFMSGLVLRQPATGFLFNLMLLMGIVLVSRLFVGFHRKENSIYLFMLPAAIEEKFLVQWLASLVGYYFYAVLAVSIGGTLANLIASILYDSAAFALSSPSGWLDSFRGYYVFHAIFFTGALVFKRNNFMKTILVLMGVGILLMIGSGMYLKNHLFQSLNSSFYYQFNGMDEVFEMVGGPSHTTLYYVKVILWIVLPLLLYFISFIKFKNSEITG